MTHSWDSHYPWFFMIIDRISSFSFSSMWEVDKDRFMILVMTGNSGPMDSLSSHVGIGSNEHVFKADSWINCLTSCSVLVKILRVYSYTQQHGGCTLLHLFWLHPELLPIPSLHGWVWVIWWSMWVSPWPSALQTTLQWSTFITAWLYMMMRYWTLWLLSVSIISFSRGPVLKIAALSFCQCYVWWGKPRKASSLDVNADATSL